MADLGFECGASCLHELNALVSLSATSFRYLVENAKSAMISPIFCDVVDIASITRKSDIF